MTIDTDITGKFSLDRLDHEELSDILSAEFGGCMQFSMTELVYPPNKHEYALKATYDKEGNIKTLSSGPLLTERRLDEIVSRIDSELVKGNEEKIASVTLFSNVPVDGYFRYRDKWQVLPPDEAASKPGFWSHGIHSHLNVTTAATPTSQSISDGVSKRPIEPN